MTLPEFAGLALASLARLITFDATKVEAVRRFVVLGGEVDRCTASGVRAVPVPLRPLRATPTDDRS